MMKGWYGDKMRHSMSARGISSKQYNSYEIYVDIEKQTKKIPEDMIVNVNDPTLVHLLGYLTDKEFIQIFKKRYEYGLNENELASIMKAQDDAYGRSLIESTFGEINESELPSQINTGDRTINSLVFAIDKGNLSYMLFENYKDYENFNEDILWSLIYNIDRRYSQTFKNEMELEISNEISKIKEMV